MHMLTLLLLGVNGIEMSSDLIEASKSKSLIESLINSEIKDSIFEDDEEEADDTANSQTDEEGDDEDSESEEAEEPEHQANVQTKTESTARVFGRNKQGLYNNHQNYMMLRNKVNEAESGHQEMFDQISERLQDSNFV